MIQAVPGATDLPVSGHAASAVGRSRRYSGMTASQRWGSRGTYVRGTSVQDPIVAKPNRARRVVALVARPVGQVLRRAESLAQHLHSRERSSCCRGRQRAPVATPQQPCQLADIPLVLHEPGSGTRATLEMAITVAGWAVCELVLELASTPTVRNAVAAGVAPIPIRALVIARMSLRGRLRIVAVTDLDRPLLAVWK